MTLQSLSNSRQKKIRYVCASRMLSLFIFGNFFLMHDFTSIPLVSVQSHFTCYHFLSNRTQIPILRSSIPQRRSGVSTTPEWSIHYTEVVPRMLLLYHYVIYELFREACFFSNPSTVVLSPHCAYTPTRSNYLLHGISAHVSAHVHTREKWRETTMAPQRGGGDTRHSRTPHKLRAAIVQL